MLLFETQCTAVAVAVPGYGWHAVTDILTLVGDAVTLV